MVIQSSISSTCIAFVLHMIAASATLKQEKKERKKNTVKSYISIRFTDIEDNCVIISLFQLIQTLSAVDKDDSYSGHQFSFSIAPEAASSSNFTLQDNRGEFLEGLFLLISLLLSVLR